MSGGDISRYPLGKKYAKGEREKKKKNAKESGGKTKDKVEIEVNRVK
jgi:hypothetical protein